MILKFEKNPCEKFTPPQTISHFPSGFGTLLYTASWFSMIGWFLFEAVPCLTGGQKLVLECIISSRDELNW